MCNFILELCGLGFPQGKERKGRRGRVSSIPSFLPLQIRIGRLIRDTSTCRPDCLGRSGWFVSVPGESGRQAKSAERIARLF